MILEDNDLKFDKNERRYYLTIDYVFNKMGTDLDIVLNDELDTNNSTLAERNIRYACDMLWDYIEDNAISPASTLYNITQNEQSFRALKKALEYQLFDFIQNGDILYEREHDISDTVNKRAIQRLDSQSLFHIYYTKIPDIKEW